MWSQIFYQFAAIAYTLIETAKINKVNPEACLAWVLERIQDHPANRTHELLPWSYQDMNDAQNTETDAKDAARPSPALIITLQRI
jgi:transposase